MKFLYISTLTVLFSISLWFNLEGGDSASDWDKVSDLDSTVKVSEADGISDWDKVPELDSSIKMPLK